MKKLILLFTLLPAIALATESKIEVQKPLRKIQREPVQITKKNTINLSNSHGMAGISYQRNYYDYAAVVAFAGTRKNPNLAGFSLGTEWTTQESTLSNGWYFMPSVVYYKSSSNSSGSNNNYSDLYGVSLRENDSALGLSFAVQYKWIFNYEKRSYIIGLGPEFIRIRSNNGMGIIANLGIVF